MGLLTAYETTTADRVLQTVIDSDPVAWMEENFYVSDPRNPITGEELPAGPIRLAPHQKAIIRYALTKVDGLFPYSTVIYSTIKKSGKTRIAAGIAAWYAATQGAYNEVYCLANDGKQSTDRILSAIKQAVELNPGLDWHTTQTRIDLPNHTFIEAIPCDPTGQAGANPGLTVWSEMWGYRHEHKERLWTEMTIPPTRFGRAIRWVESYAGYKNESATLWHLYETGVNGGVQHPAFNNIPVYVNIPASMYCYWDHGEAARRMPWQVESYYTQEHQTLTENEFERIHMNEWVEPVTKAIPIEWWDACESRDLFGSAIPPLDWRTPIVIGADAAISHDCCALVAVSRHPLDKQVPAVRLMRIWQPRKGHPINLSDTMEATLREWIKRYNVVEVTYDKYQLHKLMSDLRGTARTKDFSQGALRAVADKHLYDLIVQRSIAHSGEMELREHVDNAAAKDTGDKYRFCKMDTSTLRGGETAKPIDALVALSMAVYRCMRLNL